MFYVYIYIHVYFPTCQVRVARFYPELFFSSSSSFSFSSSSSTTSASTSMSTSALPTLRQALRQLPHAVAPVDLNCKGLSALGTAGPQPGTFRAQWAPLLNLGPAELSEHRWTSTWDPPSSVSTAGPQPGTFRAQWAPLDLNGQIECQKICQIERQIERQIACQIECQIKCQIEARRYAR